MPLHQGADLTVEGLLRVWRDLGPGPSDPHVHPLNENGRETNHLPGRLVKPTKWRRREIASRTYPLRPRHRGEQTKLEEDLQEKSGRSGGGS